MSNYPQLSLLSACLSTRNRATLSIYPYILAILYLRSSILLLATFFLKRKSVKAHLKFDQLQFLVFVCIVVERSIVICDYSLMQEISVVVLVI